MALRALADDVNWAAFLRAAAKADIELKRAVLDTALKSPSAAVAATTAWYLVERGAAKRVVDKELARLPPPAGAGSDSAFPFELLRRLAGDAAVEDEAWIASLGRSNSSGVDRIEPGSAVVALLTTKEREAARARYNRRHGISPERSGKMAPFWDPTRNRDAGIERPSDDALVARTVANLPPGLAADLLVVSGCRAGRKAIGAAEVRYNVEGRPLRVSVVQDFGSSKDCERASTSLILLSLAPPTSFPIKNRPELLVTSFGRDCIGVLDEASVANRPAAAKELEVQRVEGDIEPPILEEKVEPKYPETARQDQQEGVLILEAVIVRDGCVGELRTIKGHDERLEVAALAAVSHWRYKPARLHGKPVQVFLTVTITFTLRR
ncbi:MAG: energy transducer TonB [Acidobacteriota bacterium]